MDLLIRLKSPKNQLRKTKRTIMICRRRTSLLQLVVTIAFPRPSAFHTASRSMTGRLPKSLSTPVTHAAPIEMSKSTDHRRPML